MQGGRIFGEPARSELEPKWLRIVVVAVVVALVLVVAVVVALVLAHLRLRAVREVGRVTPLARKPSVAPEGL